MRNLINRAMHQSDDLVIELEYVDSKGNRTTRVVSPIRFLSHGSFLGLCLCRCEPRRFQIERCDKVRLRPAANYVMPVEMVPVAGGTALVSPALNTASPVGAALATA